MIIYKATNKINGKSYIGQTRRSLNVRKSAHERLAKLHCQTRFHSAIKSYGPDNFEWEVLASTDNLEELNDLEVFFIKKYDTVNKGYNMYYGGDNNAMDEEYVKLKHLERMRSPEVRKKISETMKKRRAEETEEQKIHHNRNVSIGLRKFYDSGKKPKYKSPQRLTEEHKESLKKSHYKEVYCINNKNEIIKSFSTIQEAAKWWFKSYRITIGKRKGLPVKNWHQLMDKIKMSSKNNKYVQGLKWIYRV